MIALTALGAVTGCGRPAEATVAAAPDAVTSLGRVVPGRAVIAIATAPGERIQRLFVKERDKVSASAVLAHLATHELRSAELAEARVAVAQANERLQAETELAHAQIAQAEESVHLAEAALDHERGELKRIGSLATAEALPGNSVDNQKFLVRTRELGLTKTRAELRAATAGLASTRSAVGVAALEARVASAEAALELTIVRAPIAGEILRIATYPGERIGNQPILHLGDTADMHVIAEVHQMDVRKVRLGQRVTVTSEAFDSPETGIVDEIGAMIFKNDVLDVDPRANTDTRVVEVRVKLDRGAAVAGFTNLEVHVRIELQPSTGGSPAPRR